VSLTRRLLRLMRSDIFSGTVAAGDPGLFVVGISRPAIYGADSSCSAPFIHSDGFEAGCLGPCQFGELIYDVP